MAPSRFAANFRPLSGAQFFPPVPHMRACLLPVAVYLALACRHLALPGIYDDESIFGYYALQIVRALLSGNLLDVPTGIHPYHGIASCLFPLPLILALPHSPVAALRLTLVLAGVATIVLVYRLAYHVIGRWQEAFIAACLLAISPSFVIGMRIGAYTGGLELPIEVASLYCLALWLEFGVAAHLFLSLLLLGLGLSCNSHFIFPVVATAGLIGYRLAIRDLRAQTARIILPGLGALFLGAAPLVFHVAVGFRDFWSFLQSRIAMEGSFFQGIQWSEQWARFRELADGTAFPRLIRALDRDPGNPFFPWIVGAALLLLPLSLIARRSNQRKFSKDSWEADLLIWQAIYFLTNGTVRFACLPIHIFSWLPLPQISVALALARWRPGAPRWSRLFCLVVAGILGANFFLDVSYLSRFDRYLVRTGGEDRFSSAIYDLVAWLDTEHAEKILLLARPLEYNLGFLSRMRISATNAASVDRSFPRQEVRNALAGRQRVLLIGYADRESMEDISVAAAFDEVAALGYSCVVAKRFSDRALTPVFTAWRCALRPGRS